MISMMYVVCVYTRTHRSITVQVSLSVYWLIGVHKNASAKCKWNDEKTLIDGARGRAGRQAHMNMSSIVCAPRKNRYTGKHHHLSIGIEYMHMKQVHTYTDTSHTVRISLIRFWFNSFQTSNVVAIESNCTPLRFCLRRRCCYCLHENPRIHFPCIFLLHFDIINRTEFK